MIRTVHILKSHSLKTLLSSRLIITKHFSVHSSNHYDVIIAGGGLVGTTLACVIGKNNKLHNKRVLLLESSKEKNWKQTTDKYSNRVVSLNPGTKKLLSEIDAWKHIQSVRFATVKRLQVWDAISDSSITFGEETSTDDISYIVENDLIIESVLKELKHTNNVQILYQAKVKSYKLPEHQEDHYVNVSLENGDKYSCELLLGCDGNNSEVRKAMGVSYVNWKYNQMGVVATLKLSEAIENNIAWQRFLPTGTIALLPLTENLSSLVWSTTPEIAKELLSCTEDKFVDMLNEAMWKSFKRHSLVDNLTSSLDNILRLTNCPLDVVRRYPPKIEKIGEGSRAAFPLGFGHASTYIAKGVVLVGDAAHRVHPLAGQGVNLGFGDVECLNRIIGDAVYSGNRLDDITYLKEYETERQRHNIPTMLAIEGIYRLYNTAFTPIVLLRSLGLQATNALNPLKKIIIAQAST